MQNTDQLINAASKALFNEASDDELQNIQGELVKSVLADIKVSSATKKLFKAWNKEVSKSKYGPFGRDALKNKLFTAITDKL